MPVEKSFYALYMKIKVLARSVLSICFYHLKDWVRHLIIDCLYIILVKIFPNVVKCILKSTSDSHCFPSLYMWRTNTAHIFMKCVQIEAFSWPWQKWTLFVFKQFSTQIYVWNAASFYCNIQYTPSNCVPQRRNSHSNYLL